jgi:hypothetical protein
MNSDNPEMFLYYIKSTVPEYNLPKSTQEELREAFKIHQEKLKDACWLVAHCNTIPDMPNRERRKELTLKRVEKIRDHMKAIQKAMTKESRTMMWVRVNNEKYAMEHQK